jgi:hypothetical protein
MDPDDWDDAEADSVADLEAMWDATPPAVTVLSAPAGAASRAPYPARPSPTTTSWRPGSWRDAGRSWALAARRARADRSWLRRPRPEEIRLQRRAAAARTTALALDALTGLGYVVLHDRVIAGTGQVLDHVVAGPPGLLLVATHPVTRLAWDAHGVLHDDGHPLPQELTALRNQTEELLRAVITHLPAWQLACYPAVSLVGAAAWAAWTGEPAALLTPAQLCWWAGTLPAPLAPIHVSDLALAVSTVCSPAA